MSAHRSISPPTGRITLMLLAVVAGAMRRLLERPDEYLAMRAAAWRRARDVHSLAAFEGRLLSEIDAVLAETASD